MSLADRAKALELTDLAQTCFDAGRAEDALSHADAALRCDPDSLHARLLQARIHVAQERPAEATRALNALVASHPQSAQRPDVMLLRAQALALGNQIGLAIDQLHTMSRQFPDDVRPYRLLATIHVQRNDAAQASAALQQVLRMEPSNTNAKRMLASLTAATNPQRAAERVTNLPPAAQDDAAVLAAAHWSIRAGGDADARARWTGRSHGRSCPRDPASSRPGPAARFPSAPRAGRAGQGVRPCGTLRRSDSHLVQPHAPVAARCTGMVRHCRVRHATQSPQTRAARPSPLPSSGGGTTSASADALCRRKLAANHTGQHGP